MNHEESLTSFHEIPLLEFILQDNLKEFKEIFDEKPEYFTNFRNKSSQNILHLAISNYSLKVLKYLAKLFASNKAIANDQTKWGETPLHIAASMGQIELVELVLQLPVDQSIKDNWGRTAIDLAKENGHEKLLTLKWLDETFLSPEPSEFTDFLSTTILENRVKLPSFDGELLEKLEAFKNKSKLNPHIEIKGIFTKTIDNLSRHPTNSGTQPLNQIKPALSKVLETFTDIKNVETYIESGEYDLNGNDMFGLNAFHKAASWDRVDILSLLLSNNIDVNQQSKSRQFLGFTALHFAVESGAINAIKLLLRESDIDKTIKNSFDQDAKSFALSRGMCIHDLERI